MEARMTPNSPTAAGDQASRQTPGQSTGVVDQAKQGAQQVTDQVQQTAAGVTDQAKQQVTSQVESQKERAVDSLVTVAQALRQTGQHLSEQDQTGIAHYVDQAAGRVEDLTNHLRTRDASQLLADTEDLARRNPALFLGAAVALGFVGARFLMSSGQRARAQSLGAGSAASYPYPAAYDTRPALTSPASVHGGSQPIHSPTGSEVGGTSGVTVP
jgi:uncharacterized protein YukE